MKNINDSFFSGHYKDIWRNIIPEELTVKETAFIIDYFGLSNRSHVLDLMCGYGRHSLALAEKGINVTAVDNQEEYINEIEQKISLNQLPIDVKLNDIAEFQPIGNFDLAICMGNSINFFEENTLQEIFNKVNKVLLSGGKFFINSWSIAEIAFRNFKDKSWAYVGDTKFLTDSKFCFQPTRIETETTMITVNGEIESKSAIDYIYSIRELEIMLGNAGFKLDEIYSVPPRRKFTIGEPRAYLIASKK